MPRAASADDPKPQPPVQPDLDDCCHSGCSPCVFDLYDEALERYEVALAQWQARQARKMWQARQAEEAGRPQQVKGERSARKPNRSEADMTQANTPEPTANQPTTLEPTTPQPTAARKNPPAQAHARKRR
ncbi:hypothetical protein EN871_29545 [bacterium M00.F.Ca.ET.228.01.1.1]|nr:hypothetical protein [Paraburkholderia phenoliruptrix]MBW9100710.1 hypothetical protein [Paraburkholderia phenoliruptrix]TGP40175.1 hypothetical protein EN871_29545 [bacterium M00.F.Ca.ET.228.01.1.1]TGR96150.1 hypothetical protein EN834_29150 [bacterium M00.F.Ca.ET.191.01.1.1]TGT97287.1 hypothetical protein EN798_29160 [bacterium M00.F.Ca.ET.155.01.1.1]